MSVISCSQGWDPVGGLSGFFRNRFPQDFYCTRGWTSVARPCHLPASQPQGVASPDQPTGEVHDKCREAGDLWGSEHSLHIHRRSLEATRAWSLRPERLPASSPGAQLAEGEHLGVSTAPLPSPSMKTLKKQQLEVLSIYKYVFCFLFMGEGNQAGVH